MAFLVEKRLQAPDYLVLAVDLVCGCIRSASRKISNQRLYEIIRRKFDQHKHRLWHTLRWRVTDEGVDIFDGGSSDKNHAHIGISHASATAHYWRNYGESRGPQNYLR